MKLYKVNLLGEEYFDILVLAKNKDSAEEKLVKHYGSIYDRGDFKIERCKSDIIEISCVSNPIIEEIK